MPPSSPESPIMQEIIASFIETGDYEGEGRWVVGAIRYLTRKDLNELRASSEKDKLAYEIMAAWAAESFLLSGFSEILPYGGARVRLTKADKEKNLKPFLKDIELLYSLRNRNNPEELAKLKLLNPKAKSSDYDLVVLFRQTSEWKYVIKSIKFEKREEEKPSKKESDSFIWPDGTFA